jgi:hypothetical protein
MDKPWPISAKYMLKVSVDAPMVKEGGIMFVTAASRVPCLPAGNENVAVQPLDCLVPIWLEIICIGILVVKMLEQASQSR